MRVAVQRPVDHHVEGRLRLGDPAHAVGEPGGPQTVLAQHVTLPPSTEHVGRRHHEVLDHDLRVTGRPVHGLHLPDAFHPAEGMSTKKAVLAAWGIAGILLGPGDEDGEAGPTGVGDEPLVAVDDPGVPVGHGRGRDERGVRAGNLGLGHGEAAHGGALAQRPQVALLLLVGAPVQQRVHVALVGGLAIEHEGPVRDLGRLRLDHGELDVPEAHPSPLLGHVGQPEAGLPGSCPQRDEQLAVRVAIRGAERLDLRLGR